MEQITEIAAGELFNITKKFVNSIIDKRKWKSFFSDTLRIYIDDEKKSEFFDSQLQGLFNEGNIRELASLMHRNNGFTFKQIVEKKVRELVSVWDVEDSEKDLFINRFMDSLYSYIEKTNPKYYEQYLINSTYEIVKVSDKNIIETKKITDEIYKIVSSPKNVLNSYQINWSLDNGSEKKIDLSFFESDDNEFKKNFSNKIKNKENVYAICYSRMEALFSILYELKLLGYEAYVIYSENDWIRIEQSKLLTGKIVIPFFMSNIITPLSNNINIFIYDQSYNCIRNDAILIQRRKYKTISNKLSLCGYSSKEIHDIIDNSHGFFFPLIKRLLNRAQVSANVIINEEDRVTVLCGLMLGQWKDIDGDKTIIEKLSGISYDEFILTITKYTKGENPLFFKYNLYGETKYLAVSIDDSLTLLMDYIPKNVWAKYLELATYVLFNVDNAYKNLNQDNPFVKNVFSNSLKEGLTKSLLFIKYNVDVDDFKNKDIFKWFKDSLDSISNKESWANVSKNIKELCELEPDLFLTRLEEEVYNVKNTEFLELFRIDKDYFWGENYYIQYLWALELFLSTKKYASRSIDILFKLYEYDFKFKMSNSPKDILNDVFCAWMNKSVFKNEEKVALLDKYVGKNIINIYFVLNNLPNRHSSIIDNFYEPRYLISEVEPDVYMNELGNVYVGYLDLCLKYADTDYKILLNLLDDIQHYDVSLINNFFERLPNFISRYNDEVKYDFYIKIRHIIYDHRHFSSAGWAMPESVLSLYLKAMNSIEFTRREYYFKYLFNEYKFPVLSPVPYNEESYNYHDNDKIRETEIQNKINDFLKENLKIEDLISIIDSPQTTLGFYLNYFFGEKIDKVNIECIIKNQKVNEVFDKYAFTLYKKDPSHFFDMIDYLIEINYSISSISYILKYYRPIDDNFIDYITNKNDELNKVFWSQDIYIDSDSKCILRCFECIKKYGNVTTYIEALYYIFNKLQFNDVYSILIGVLDFDIKRIEKDISYQLSEILEYFKNRVLDDIMIEKLSSIEVVFYQFLQWKEMYFFNMIVRKNPKVYSDIVRFVFKDDAGNFHENHDVYIKNLFSLYYKMEFCPGVIDGKMDKNIFENWVKQFKNQLTEQNQLSMFTSLMGRLCSYSTNGADGLPLDECVRNFIENNFDQHMLSSFVSAEYNKRGVYSASEGKQEELLSEKYKKIADAFRIMYPKCSKIYDCISEDYHIQSINESKAAKYE